MKDLTIYFYAEFDQLFNPPIRKLLAHRSSELDKEMHPKTVKYWCYFGSRFDRFGTRFLIQLRAEMS